MYEIAADGRNERLEEGEYMALEMISSIQKAEAEAERTVKDAQTQARQILKDATDRSYQAGNRMEEETEREVDRLIAEGAASARQECEETLRLAEREISAMQQLCAAKMDKAVQLIVNRISE